MRLCIPKVWIDDAGVEHCTSGGEHGQLAAVREARVDGQEGGVTVGGSEEEGAEVGEEHTESEWSITPEPVRYQPPIRAQCLAGSGPMRVLHSA